MIQHDTQQQLITGLSDTTALVLAGPGCGKTHILARRVFHASAHVAPESMLCVTFTNRAAREMKQRIEGYLGYVPDNLFIGNMHRFCLRFLFCNNILEADTSVLDEEDQADYLATILPNPTAARIKDFLTKASYLYQTGNDHPEWIVRHPSEPFAERDYVDIDTYVNFKKANRLVDYDDILLMTYTALQQRQSNDYLMADYQWVQVDEVQDMTPLQLAIVESVVRRHRRTLIYFGDEQQAIFRFLGAGGRALEVLKNQCRGNIMRLRRNYRSPGYLVEMCNRLATDSLGLEREFLPEAVDCRRDMSNMILYCGDTEAIALTAANICRKWIAEHPDESVAVLCRLNKEADELSELFSKLGLSHFHVSKQDIFHQLTFKTIWSHLAVVCQPFLVHPWARLLYQLKCVSTLTGARNLVRLLRDSAVGCEELLYIEKPFKAERLIDICTSDREIVVFDTETTGLDVDNDDIVQIAAVKIVRGEFAGRFEVFVESNRELLSELAGGIANPLVQDYACADRLCPEMAFRKFFDFAGKAILAGHNLDFDIPMMRSNLTRRTHLDLPWQLTPGAERLDTLVLSRLLYPKAHSHRLSDMIALLDLDGSNTHNASDDAAATARLLLALASRAEEVRHKMELIHLNHKIQHIAEKFKAAYSEFYHKWRSMRYYTAKSEANSLSGAIRAADIFLSRHGYCSPLPRIDYILALVDRCIVDSTTPPTFGTQVNRHLFDLLSFNESDLYTNGIINEQLSVMTIHKAKGLEMDNVIVYDVSKPWGPDQDHARLLYVAFSRARQRLAIGLSGNMPHSMHGLHHYFNRMTSAQVRLAVNSEILKLKDNPL